MIEVIGVKFKSGGKMYYFAPGDLNPAEGSYVVVETARGAECGEVAARRHAVPEESITAPLKPILRLATEEDLQILEKNRAYMADAFRICQERIEARELPMHLVDVECGFDSNKLIFYFTAESRVDFRELVKDLANAFHVRIELRQIGDRDEAKLLGGLGICGREFCCKRYLNNFQPISIKMAKEQGLALNPTKISGACGRLMCCLRYESPVYEELIKLTPKVGSTVILPGEVPVRAYVTEVNLVTGNLRVKPENSDMPITVNRDQVERLQDASRRMTKEDLREKRQPASAPAPQQSQKPQQSDAHAAQDAPRSQHPQKPQRQPKQQAPERAAQAAQSSALHPEFGEKQQTQHQQKAPAPQPRRSAPLPDDMDFTEHRAVVEHPELAAEQAQQRQRNHDGGRRPRRGGQNRRFNNHRGTRGHAGEDGQRPAAPHDADA
ncbi:MAG: stage 0 sporulation family protein [Oscillospiraceae bacterium]|nr:stage 0 sporulation family protein [Oscillospiraceae bacterium]